MSYLSRTVARVRNNEPLPALLGGALRLVSLGQRLGMWVRLRRKTTRVPAYVISYGNLTAGGTGKTPAVIERAAQEVRAGKQVAVLTRGYGAAPLKKPLVLKPGKGAADIARQFGDEAALIARRVPGVWIVRWPDRVRGARIALEHGCSVLILDDGFQAVTLERDENILLIDASNPFGNGCLVPRGILREPLSAMCRATEIRLTRCDQAPGALEEITAVLRQLAPETPVSCHRHVPTELLCLATGERCPLSLVQDAEVSVVCGIGNPEAFTRTLQELGAVVGSRHVLQDHAPIPPELLRSDRLVVMTEKDAMRLGACPAENVYALCIAMMPYTPDISLSTLK